MPELTKAQVDRFSADGSLVAVSSAALHALGYPAPAARPVDPTGRADVGD